MRRFYNDEDRWEIWAPDRLRHRELVAMESVAPRMKPGTRVLDVGCGPGTFLTALQQKEPQARFVGMDIATRKLEAARAAMPDATFVEASVEEPFPFDDASFDIVHSAEVLEHLFDPDAMIRSCRRVLRPGGTLVLTTPNLAAWYNRGLLLMGVQPLFVELSTVSSVVGAGATRRFRKGHTPVGHMRIFTLTGVEDLLELHGFRVTRRRAASFHAFDGLLVSIDRVLAHVPSLGSFLVVTATTSDTP